VARMHEKRVRDAEASRKRLLEAGVKVFSECGPDGGSVSMIARAAGINRRMLYHYFGSKEGLYRAAFRHAYEQLSSAEVELADMALNAEDLLVRMIRSYYEFHATHPHHVRLLMWENLRQGKVASDMRLGAIKTPILDALRIALARGKAEGRFRRDVDEKHLLISCMGMCFFCFSNRHTISQALGFDLVAPGAVERCIHHDVRLLLEGIRVKKSGRSKRVKGEPS